MGVSQKKYVAKVLARFNMSEAKPVGSALATNYKLNDKQWPKSEKEKAEMGKVPYALAIGNLI